MNARLDARAALAADMQIDAQAKASAAELLHQGWTGEPQDYGIGDFHGDVEALGSRLGRQVTRDECAALERAIRAELARSAS